MGTKQEVINEFNSFTEAKKKNVSLVKFVVGAAFICVIISMLLSFVAYKNAMNKILVVNESGEYLKISAEKNQDLFVALVKNTCAQFTYYLNSFERTNLTKQQAHAAFYCNDGDLKSVFAYYKGKNTYYDVLERGVIYRCELEQVSQVGTTEPYLVTFTSILTIIDGAQIQKYRISSEGTLVKVAPQFPENVTGFIFNSYKQTVQELAAPSSSTQNNSLTD